MRSGPVLGILLGVMASGCGQDTPAGSASDLVRPAPSGATSNLELAPGAARSLGRPRKASAFLRMSSA